MSISKARSGLLQRLQQRRQRQREGCFVVEGTRGAAAALEGGASVRFAVTSPRLASMEHTERVQGLLTASKIEVVAIEDVEFAALSSTVTPQGILLVCDEPVTSLAELADPARDGLLIADGIQDPSNLASMIRSAAALGLGGLIALDGTVDPWNAKVVRGSAGASFHLPIVSSGCAEALAWIDELGIDLLAAAADGNDVATVRAEPPWALAVGNEGAGLRGELRTAARDTVAVPIRPEAESLNAGVAAAILCYELRR